MLSLSFYANMRSTTNGRLILTEATSPNSVNHSHSRRTGRAYNCKSDTAASDKAFAPLTQPVQLHAYVYVHAYAFVSDAASDKAQRQRLPLRTCAMTPHQHGGHITSQTRTTYTTTPRIPTRTCCFVRAKTPANTVPTPPQTQTQPPWLQQVDQGTLQTPLHP